MLFSIQPFFQVLPWKYRRALFRRMGISFAEGSFLERGASFTGGKVSFGQKSYVNQGLFIEGHGAVSIGQGVSIGSEVQIITSHHDITENPKARASWKVTYKPVTIADGVWVGSGAMILPGCFVAEGCVIGAGAVITKSTEPNGLYLGTPARRVRELPTSETRSSGHPEAV